MCSDKVMKIALDIEEKDIERIVRSLDNQFAYTLARDREDSGCKRLAALLRVPRKADLEPGGAVRRYNHLPVTP